MKNAALSGKPYAGNPHVRFDEGEVASAKPRRGSLLYKITISCSLALLASAVFAGQPLVSVDKVERKGKWLVVDYTLSGDRGIVTPSLLTNGVPVAENLMTTFEGDICKLVEPGARQFRWNACADWPKQTLPDATVRLVAPVGNIW